MDLCWTSTRILLAFCDIDWASTGPLLHFYWTSATSTGPLLDLYWCWTSVGPLLDLYWTTTGPLLDLDWTGPPTGTLLNFYWTCTCTGPLLDLYWTATSFGVSRAIYKIHARWTSTRPLLDLLLNLYSVADPQKMGPLMCLGGTVSGAGTPSLYIYWISTGTPRELYLTSTEPQLVFYWTSTGPRQILA